MNLFIDQHQDFMKLLLLAEVDFIVIGGYAAIYHGYKRTTGDVDLWLKPDNTNKERLLATLQEYGFDADETAPIAGLDFTKHQVLSIGEEPARIDLLTYINGVKYDEADAKKIIAHIDGINIPFLHLTDLILSKISTGRPKDKADVDMLQKIEQAKHKK